jgi:hypothetical protein
VFAPLVLTAVFVPVLAAAGLANLRLGWAILAAMGIPFVAGVAACWH